MPGECAAVNCKKKGGTQHRFPLKNPALLRQWLANMKREDPETKKPWQPSKYDTLCEKHFVYETSYTMKTRLLREQGIKYTATLEPTAVPTIFEHRKRSSEQQTVRGAFAKRQRAEVSVRGVAPTELLN